MENINGCNIDTKDSKDTKDIKDEKRNSEDCASEGSSDSEEPNDSDEEMEEPNHYYKPEQLMEALNSVKNLPPDYVITFELTHAPLLVIAKTANVSKPFSWCKFSLILNDFSWLLSERSERPDNVPNLQPAH